MAPEKAFFDKFKNQEGMDYCPVNKFTKGYKPPKGTKNMDITLINYPDNFFDAILCSHVLEHIPDDKQAMKELCRVLKPDGWAILQVPIDYENGATLEDSNITSPEDREKYYGQYDHLRLYGRDYPIRLRNAGFKVECVDFVKTFSKEEQIRYGLDANDGIIYLCSK